MLDRSTPNLFQAEQPAAPEPPPRPLEDVDTQVDPEAPPPSGDAREWPTFTFAQLGGPHRARARAAWRTARRFLTLLLIVLAVFRLAAGGCGTPSAPTPSAVTARPPGVRAHLARPAPVKRVLAAKRPTRRALQHRRPPVLATPRPVAHISPVPPAPAPSTIAAPPAETPATQPVAATPGEGQEFGFEH
jgi:hypothetical protein